MPIRILLDECLPRRLKQDLREHDVSTVPEMGWASQKNGALLRLADPLFDVFLTMDRQLASQQNLSTFSLMVVCLKASSNRYLDLAPLLPQVEQTVSHLRPGQFLLLE